MQFQNKADALLDRILANWSTLVIRYPRWILLVILLACVASGYYTYNNLGVNTDTTGMLSSDLQFKKDNDRLTRAFPDDSRAILVVVNADGPELTTAAVKTLANRFQDEKGAVETVYLPNQDPFFERNGLLYLDIDELDQIALDITRAQPFIGRLSQRNTLDELLKLLNQALTQSNRNIPIALDLLFEELSRSVAAALDGRPYVVSWQKEMLGEASEFNQSIGFILVRPHFNYNDFIPAEKSFNAIRAISRDFESEVPGVRVRLTGEVALEHEELESLSQGTEIAGLASLILVCFSLLWALRSLKLAFATLIALLVGLIFSAAVATLTVGHLNLISIAFAVLYIGLGVDYAIHLSLRFEDLVRSGIAQNQAIIDSVRSVGPSIILCALTTALGFYAFVPTAYTGVSELGIISGNAMFVGLVVTLTLLPAIFAIQHFNWKGLAPVSEQLPPSWYRFPLRYSRWIKIGTLFLAAGACFCLTKASFDFDPISLRDQQSESVTTFRELLQNETNSPLLISVIANNQSEVAEKTAKLKQLDSVANVIGILDFIPSEQEEKIEIIQVLDESLGPVLQNFPNPGPVDTARQIAEIKQLIGNLNRRSSTDTESTNSESIESQLRSRLQGLLESLETLDPEHAAKLLATIQHSMLANLAPTIESLNLALGAQEFDRVDELPKTFVRRWLSPDGLYRLLVMPKKDLNDLDNMRKFVNEVQSVEPHATDLPVFYAESGKEVVKAFQQALSYAVLAIVLISLIILRNLRETVLVLLPLLLASVLTGAATVIFDNPFNFANIIVLPVLLGIGIDSSIHVVHRLRQMSDRKSDILRTSTARGIFFSGLTTVFSFTSLTFISHAGTASLGFLLTVGIVCSLFCTLVVLPAFAVRNAG